MKNKKDNEMAIQKREDTMTNLMFDTLQFAKRAEEAGFTKNQAEFQAEEIAKVMETQLITKHDLLSLENNFNKSLVDLELRLILKFGGMLAIGIGILTAVVKWGTH